MIRPRLDVVNGAFGDWRFTLCRDVLLTSRLRFVLLLSSEVWAIGLGDIQLDSALNEPLRAEIELLSATPEELADLERDARL